MFPKLGKPKKGHRGGLNSKPVSFGKEFKLMDDLPGGVWQALPFHETYIKRSMEHQKVQGVSITRNAGSKTGSVNARVVYVWC